MLVLAGWGIQHLGPVRATAVHGIAGVEVVDGNGLVAEDVSLVKRPVEEFGVCGCMVVSEREKIVGQEDSPVSLSIGSPKVMSPKLMNSGA